MAGTAVNKLVTTAPDSDQRAAITALNLLITDVETLRAGLAATSTAVNAVITAAATNLAAVAAVTAVTRTTFDTAGDLAAFKVNNPQGTAI